MNMNRFIVSRAGMVLVIGCIGCGASAPPRDLVAARKSYQHAQEGAAAEHNPADLHTAKESLEAAEKSFAEDGDTPKTRALAYTAERRARIAEARANATQATELQKKTVEAMHATQTERLGSAEQRLAAQKQEMAGQAERLEMERQARIAADERAAQAAADLAEIATVEKSERGMVITLSGGVLFASAKDQLLPGARRKLNSVADALAHQDPDSTIVVEGHTDSQGRAEYNQALSERRAQTVVDYLVSRGVAADRISAQGFGSSRPIADNESAEGRANNRRVEIVVEP